MDWFRAVNSYCERTGPGLLVRAAQRGVERALPRCGLGELARWRAGTATAAARLLALILAAIGIGSSLFHTHAQVWAMLADVVPIQVFILVYLALATDPVLRGAAGGAASLAAAAFVPASALACLGASAPLFGPLNGSVGYLPVPILIALYALRAPPARPGGGARPRGSARRSSRFRWSSAPSTRRSAARCRSAPTSSGTC